MPSPNNAHQQELKLVQLIAKFESIEENCARITKQIDDKLATKTDLELVHKDTIHLTKAIDDLNDATEKSIEKQTAQIDWLIRGLFMLMASGIAGIGWFVVKTMIGS